MKIKINKFVKNIIITTLCIIWIYVSTYIVETIITNFRPNWWSFPTVVIIIMSLFFPITITIRKWIEYYK
jgi:uncharacterized membrane protein YhaH (DUF805 family)